MDGFNPLAAAQMAAEARPQIDDAGIQYIFSCCCCDESLLREAANLIEPGYFLPQEEVLALFFQSLIRARQQYQTLHFDVVSRLLRESLEMAGTPVNQDFMEALLRQDEHGLVWPVLNARIDKGGVSYGRELLQQFLYERSVYGPLRRVVSGGGTLVPDVTSFIEGLQRHAMRIRSMSRLPCGDVAPDRDKPFIPASNFSLTGVPLFDDPLQGQREGDCNGILGVQGAGKTALGIHFGVAVAKTIYSQARDSGTSPRFTAFVTYEESQAKLTPRFWSAAFGISYERLQRMRSWDELSGPDNLHAYEQRHAGPRPLSERERYDAGQAWLRKCFAVVDHSGSAEYPDAGGGGVAEVVSTLDRICNDRQQNLHTVVIDYAGIMIERFMQSTKTDERARRTALKYLGLNLKQQVAERFGCTVWLLHQIKGEAGKYPPTRLMHHTDGAETRDFSENMAVCGCLGTEDKATGCRRFNWSKVRYRPGERLSPYTLRFNEHLALLEDVTTSYTVDERNGMFLPQREQQTIGGIEGALPRRVARHSVPAATLAGTSDQPSD